MKPSETYAILIGIQSYLDRSHIPDVPYAEADLIEMRQTLLGFGYPKENILVLLNEQASKTTIQFHAKSFRDRIGQDDRLLIFFKGHGFTTNHTSFLAGFDTQSSDLISTGIGLADLLKTVRSSQSQRIQLFLDCGHDKPLVNPGEAPRVFELAESTLKLECEEAESVFCFQSCRPHEQSYASDRLKRGIWAYHLTRALGGEEPAILESDGRLTAVSLQNYLKRVVAVTVRETFNDRRTQTPWLFASADLDEPIADLTSVLAKKRAEGSTRSNKIHDIVFKQETSVPIRSLAGYMKPMVIPKGYSNFTRSFVVKVAQADLDQDLERMYSQIQQGLKYTRKQIQVTRPGGSESGSIWTPDFQYSVSVSQSEADTSEALILRELSDVRNEEILSKSQFRDIFNNGFHTIQMTFSRPVKVVDIIDAIEALEGDKVEVTYPTDLSYCDIAIESCPGSIRVNENHLDLAFSKRLPLPAMVEAFMLTIQSMQQTGIDGHLALPGPDA